MVAASIVFHRKTDVGRVCVCVQLFNEFIRYNGIAICSRLAGGGRGPSVDLVLVAVPFFWLAAIAKESNHQSIGPPIYRAANLSSCQLSGLCHPFPEHDRE